PNEKSLYVHGNAVFQSRPCLVLRSPPSRGAPGNVEEYWVDVSRSSSVVRYLLWAKTTPAIELSTSYAERGGTWYPDEWTYTRRDAQGKVQSVERIRVAELILNAIPAPSDFTFDITPAMVVARSRIDPPEATRGGDVQIGEEHVYRVNQNGNWVEIDKSDGRA